MHINARLDEEAQQQITDQTRTAGLSVSDVVRASVARDDQVVLGEQGRPSRLRAMIGQGDSGRSDTASRYKDLLTESLAQKHGLSTDERDLNVDRWKQQHPLDNLLAHDPNDAPAPGDIP